MVEVTKINDLQTKILEKPLIVLSGQPAKSKDYKKAIDEWPNDLPIWPYLKTRSAREELVRFILVRDDTSQRKYESFDSLCTGFAAQVYSRYSNRGMLDPGARKRLATAKVDATRKELKFQIPLVMATYPGHFFNAVLMNEAAPKDFQSYLVIEPQTDEVIQNKSLEFLQYVKRFGIRMVDLTDYTDQSASVMQYRTAEVATFFVRGDDKIVSMQGASLSGLAQDFMIGYSDKAEYDEYLKGDSYVEFIRRRVKTWEIQDAALVTLGSILGGREIRMTPDGPPVKLTMEKYLQILGRPELKL
ncbi:hypothetical protein WDW37_04170 [Bdellovibrionota bacterium FG-1]